MKISLSQQIDEVNRELAERKRVYSHLVATRKLRQSVADFQTARMQAVLATLEWLQENETDIRAAVAAIKERRRASEQQHSEGEGNIAGGGEGDVRSEDASRNPEGGSVDDKGQP